MNDNPLFSNIAERSVFCTFQYRVDTTTPGITYYGRAQMDIAEDQVGWALARKIVSGGIEKIEIINDEACPHKTHHYKWSDRTGYFSAVLPSDIVFDSMFILVQKRDFTETLLNRSVHYDVSELVEYTSKGLWMKIFPTSTHYYILEVEKSQLQVTDVYDNFEWYTRAEIEDLLATEAD